MNKIIEKENIKIENMIYEVREKQVMMDSDLAKLYECKNGTKEINQAVRNNIEKFPERFSWVLTDEEYSILRSKILTLNPNHEIGKRKYKPRVFTEQGVAILSTILKSSVATKVSISIMDAFISMRKYISNNLIDLNKHSNMLIDHEDKIKILENTFSKFETFSNELSLLLDIFNTSKKSIVIIDNYISKELLDVLSKTNKKVTIHTKNIDQKLINKY